MTEINNNNNNNELLVAELDHKTECNLMWPLFSGSSSHESQGKRVRMIENCRQNSFHHKH
jgi:hypothetical protein